MTDQHHNQEVSTMKIRTEVGDPVRAAELAALQPWLEFATAIVAIFAEDPWTAKAVAAGKAIPAFRTVDSIVGDLATQRDAWAATHTLKDANPRERRIIRGREELTAAGEQAGASR